MRRKIAYPLATLGMVASTVAIASPALAHGYVSSPPSRQALCAAGEVADCGAIQYEPQSVEAPKGSKECNGGNASFTVLSDESRSWPATSVSGKVTFNWVLTARHRTASWVYYVDGTQVASFDYANAIPEATVSQTVDLSAYSGDHTVLTVWNIGDTANAFYSCVDLNINGSGSATSSPSPSPSASPSSSPTATVSASPSASASRSVSSASAGVAAWAPGVSYKTGDKVTYQGTTYQCRQSHSSIRSWEPSIYTLALWLPL
ncbi:lytic polysaccharide monooxygenase [Actinoplanes sp. NPDC051851]|uniref:lytic polysaccharide monooxygenase n=1 Tax=Actinoplanes sp. NPDC051851 TaxID=3154753 RepID=UPI00341C3116